MLRVRKGYKRISSRSSDLRISSIARLLGPIPNGWLSPVRRLRAYSGGTVRDFHPIHYSLRCPEANGGALDMIYLSSSLYARAACLSMGFFTGCGKRKSRHRTMTAFLAAGEGSGPRLTPRLRFYLKWGEGSDPVRSGLKKGESLR